MADSNDNRTDGYIYLITNEINRKSYVGQTRNTIRERWATHKLNARKGVSGYLYNAMRADGIEHFHVKQICKCDALLLDDLEKHYIQFFGTYAPNGGHGYNMHEGGDVRRGWKYTPEQIRANRSKWTPELRKKASAAIKAGYAKKVWTAEEVEQRSIRMRGKPAHNKGKPGRRWTDEQKRKASKSHEGVKLSPEHREAIKASQIIRFERERASGYTIN